jgi:hypothetical protein
MQSPDEWRVPIPFNPIANPFDRIFNRIFDRDIVSEPCCLFPAARRPPPWGRVAQLRQQDKDNGGVEADLEKLLHGLT